MSDLLSIPEAEAALETAKTLRTAAQATLQSALLGVKSAESLAQEASTAFKSKPTAKAFSDKAVADQLLENAREAHRDAQRAEHTTSVEVQRAATLLEALLASANAARYQSELDDEIKVLLEAEALIRETVGDIRVRNQEHTRDLQAMSNAGMSVSQYRAIGEAELRQRIRTELQARYGSTPAFLGQVEPVHTWIAVSP